MFVFDQNQRSLSQTRQPTRSLRRSSSDVNVLLGRHTGSAGGCHATNAAVGRSTGIIACSKHFVTAAKSRVRKGGPSLLDEGLVAFASGRSDTATIPSVVRAVNGPQSFRNQVHPPALTVICCLARAASLD